MADAVTSTTLVDSDRVTVIQLTNTSDGTGEAAVTKVDVSALNPSSNGQACTGVRLAKICYSTFGMSVKLLWDATTDAICWDLNANYADSEDFTEFSGIVNIAGTGKTGDINLTTTGHSSGDSYVIVLTLIKNYGQYFMQQCFGIATLLDMATKVKSKPISKTTKGKGANYRSTKSGAGMTKKGVAAYRKANPGSKLKTAVTGKVKKGSKAAKRRKSYCARSLGQLKKSSAKTRNDPNSRIRQARKRWKC